MISRVCYCFRLSRVPYSLYCNKLSVHNSHAQFFCYNLVHPIHTFDNDGLQLGQQASLCSALLNIDEKPLVWLKVAVKRDISSSELNSSYYIFRANFSQSLLSSSIANCVSHDSCREEHPPTSRR